LLLLRQVVFALFDVGVVYFSFSAGRALPKWIESLWIRIVLLSGTYVLLLLIVWTSLGSFFATLTDATPLDEGPVFNLNWGKLGEAAFLFVDFILPALVGMLVGEKTKKLENG
jgi:hypothetical protein